MTLPENIDIENPQQLLTYLYHTNRLPKNEHSEFVNLQGGVSNRTVWVQRRDSTDWILKQALEKLRVQVDWFSAPERIHREALGLRWLSKITPEHVPTFIFEDMDFHILAMSAIPQPHENWKVSLLNNDPVIQHAVQFGELLSKIHNAVDKYPDIATDFA